MPSLAVNQVFEFQCSSTTNLHYQSSLGSSVRLIMQGSITTIQVFINLPDSTNQMLAALIFFSEAAETAPVSGQWKDIK